jgi:hypothetical protein
MLPPTEVTLLERIVALEEELRVAIVRLEYYAELHGNDRLKAENKRMKKLLKQRRKED